MPALGCMAAVTDRGLGFEAFADGAQNADFPETSFFDQERTHLWLTKDIRHFFDSIPAEWLPRVPASARSAS